MLSIHQPNFIPWQGYFSKIKNSDIFVILDSVQYPRGKSIANRNKLRSKNNEIELVVPISKKSGSKGIFTYLEAEISEANWFVKPLKSIKHSYSKAPYYNEYFEKIEKVFKIKSFFDLNVEFIKFVNEVLNIDTKIVFLSELQDINSDKNNRILELCNLFGATQYLSGNGGKNYNDEQLFKFKNIELIYMDYYPPKYEQFQGDYFKNLSVLDLIFNHGSNSSNYI